MITDLFSHKIHSSDDDWQDKLIEIAVLFSEFDGLPYNRDAIEARLRLISPRSSYAARDISKFRDEISAYPSYLGLYYLERSPGGWVLRLTETAKRFLVIEEPDVGAFLRLQLPLFQYPNAMGSVYRSSTNINWLQANARDRTLEFIAQGIHLSPLRLIVSALIADATLRGVELTHAAVTYEEIFGLANDPSVNRETLPSEELALVALENVRGGRGNIPPQFERRFHILNHLDLFNVASGSISLRETISDSDSSDLVNKVLSISAIDSQFNEFDAANSGRELAEIIATCNWGRYFDGFRTLNSGIVEILSRELPSPLPPAPPGDVPPPPPTPETFPLQERVGTEIPPQPSNRRRELANPELTKIKQQRRNLIHKELIGKMDQLLRELGAVPRENPHIDLYAEIPDDGSFIFEMKSGGPNLLDQIRKGLSQLYEYRYRYSEHVQPDSSLCLVLPSNPTEIPWLIDYLCRDRGISICWFDEDNNLNFPDPCANTMENLMLAPGPQ